MGFGVWGLGFGVWGLGLVKRTSSQSRTAAANIGRGGGRSMVILFRASTLIGQKNVRGLGFCFFDGLGGGGAAPAPTKEHNVEVYDVDVVGLQGEPGQETCHMSHVTRHTSHVTRHTSHVTRHTSPVHGPWVHESQETQGQQQRVQAVQKVHVQSVTKIQCRKCMCKVLQKYNAESTGAKCYNITMWKRGGHVTRRM